MLDYSLIIQFVKFIVYLHVWSVHMPSGHRLLQDVLFSVHHRHETNAWEPTPSIRIKKRRNKGRKEKKNKKRSRKGKQTSKECGIHCL